MSYDDEHLEQVLKELGEFPEDFNDWECNFIDSVTRQYNAGRVLSDRQMNVINKLYNKLPPKEREVPGRDQW